MYFVFSRSCRKKNMSWKTTATNSQVCVFRLLWVHSDLQKQHRRERRGPAQPSWWWWWWWMSYFTKTTVKGSDMVRAETAALVEAVQLGRCLTCQWLNVSWCSSSGRKMNDDRLQLYPLYTPLNNPAVQNTALFIYLLLISSTLNWFITGSFPDHMWIVFIMHFLCHVLSKNSFTVRNMSFMSQIKVGMNNDLL